MLPSLVLLFMIGGWQAYVTIAEVPHYILPSPLLIGQTLINDWGLLWPAMAVTGRLTMLALLFAIIGGLAMALAFTESKWVEMVMCHHVNVLQATSAVSVAPLLPFYVNGAFTTAILS